MDLRQKLAEILEVDITKITDDKWLSHYENYDSLAVVSIAAFLHQYTGTPITRKEVLSCNTVAELIEFASKRKNFSKGNVEI